MVISKRLKDDKLSWLLLCDFKERTHRKGRICEDQEVDKISSLWLAQQSCLGERDILIRRLNQDK